jgi:hypothetical protein
MFDMNLKNHQKICRMQNEDFTLIHVLLYIQFSGLVDTLLKYQMWMTNATYVSSFEYFN